MVYQFKKGIEVRLLQLSVNTNAVFFNVQKEKCWTWKLKQFGTLA